MNWFIFELCLSPLGLKKLHYPTATVAPVSSPNVTINTSNPSAVSVSGSSTAHNAFIPGHSSGALGTKFTLSVPNNNPELSEEMTPSPRSESADASAAYSQSFIVHAMLKESTAKPFASCSQTFTVDEPLRESTVKPSVSGSQFEGEVRYAHGLCNSKGLPFSSV